MQLLYLLIIFFLILKIGLSQISGALLLLQENIFKRNSQLNYIALQWCIT